MLLSLYKIGITIIYIAMKKIFVIFCFAVFSSGSTVGRELNKECEKKANEIAESVGGLDARSTRLVYNVVDHIDKRMNDVPLGVMNYKKLMSYIDQERVDMMKVILTSEQFKRYTRQFDSTEKDIITMFCKKNDDYIRQYGVLSQKIAESNLYFESDDSEESSDD